MLKHSNRYFKLTIFYNTAVFTVFFKKKKCSLGEHKRLSPKKGGGGGIKGVGGS